TDFGIAAIEGDSTITRTGELVGSIDYLAPERVRGGAPGPASDLWALGATLYTAVEGASPFRRTSPISTMQAVVTEELPPAAHAGALGPVITALLRKDPADRPAAAEAEHMLVEALEGRAPSATRAYAPPRSVTRDEVREGAAGGRGDGLPDTAGQPSPSQSVTGTLHGRQTASGAPADGPHPAGRSGTRATGTTLHDLTGGTHGPGPGGSVGGPSPGRPGPRFRTRRTVLAVLAAALVGAGTSFAVLRYAGDGGSPPGGGPSATAAPRAGTSAEAAVGTSGTPEGWRRVQDPEGFSLLVPEGWTRQTDGDQIDYTPDNGRHRIRISVDRSPDFENPYMHMLDVERRLKDRLPEYRRIQLHANTFRDQLESCLWEFTWQEEKDHPGRRHAIDQVYYTDGGTEYALYMSSPEESWATTREQFEIVLRHWRPAEE
ncbi:serine/threonine-protein kinase, partial [Streptomyces sp. CC77]|uniref:serine/threonine-protein kinase n=1 Tax=Streptomyces sp. CC77 TaxID=1906739 RepID=UPI0008DEA020